MLKLIGDNEISFKSAFDAEFYLKESLCHEKLGTVFLFLHIEHGFFEPKNDPISLCPIISRSVAQIGVNAEIEAKVASNKSFFLLKKFTSLDEAYIYSISLMKGEVLYIKDGQANYY